MALNGHFAVSQVLDGTAREFVHQEDWDGLDAYFHNLTSSDGELFKLLSTFCKFEAIEFIISIRDAKNEWEEDGIWHDDGSRKMAFSLSLTDEAHKIKGGVLEIKKKNSETSLKIPPFSYGEMIVFATGIDSFEHKINGVSFGRRIIIAGWCQ